jgi:hypothetical protein
MIYSLPTLASVDTSESGCDWLPRGGPEVSIQLVSKWCVFSNKLNQSYLRRMINPSAKVVVVKGMVNPSTKVEVVGKAPQSKEGRTGHLEQMEEGEEAVRAY